MTEQLQLSLFIPSDEPRTNFHWGKWVHSEEPITGVVSCHSLEWIYEETDYRAVANLSYDGYIKEGLREKTNEWQHTQEDINAMPDDDLLEEWRDELGEQYEESGDTYLIGAWYFDEMSRQWEIDKSPDIADDEAYAAIVDYDFSGGIVHVVYSRFVTRAALGSPCIPGQCDLDTEGDYLAYDLPLSFYGENRQNSNPQMIYWITPATHEDDLYWGIDDLQDWARLTNSHIYPQPKRTTPDGV